MNISPISPIKVNQLQEIAGPKKPTSPSGVQQASQSFESMLNALNTSQTESDNLVQKLSLGENVDLHQVMIGMEQNSVNFQVAIAMRDKLVDAYREVMRMNI
jgi:flagellar hook-basal body complex protein FliE